MGGTKSATFPTAPSEDGTTSDLDRPIDSLRRQKKKTWGKQEDESGSTTPTSSRRPSPNVTILHPSDPQVCTKNPTGNSDNLHRLGGDITIEKIENGISLRFIKNEFIVQCGGREVLKCCTVEEVVARFILPSTAEDRQSYCEKLRNDSHPAVKQKAQVYLIYPSETKFMDIVEMLEEQYLTQGKDVILWWDIFCLHKAALRKQSFSRLEKQLLCRLLQRVDKVNVILIKDAGNGMLHSGKVLIQCYYAIEEKADFNQVEFLMSKETKFQLHSANPDQAVKVFVPFPEGEDEISKMLVEKLEPGVLSFVKEQIGLLPFHHKIFSLLRQWLMSYMEDLYQNTYDLKRRMSLEKALMDLYRVEGIAKSKLCSNVFQNVIFRAQSTETEGSILETLDLLNKIGSLFAKNCNYDDAESCYQICLQKRKTLLDKRHVDVIATENNLVTLAQLRGDIEHMTSFISLHYSIRKREFGVIHPITIETIDYVSKAYELAGREKEVESILLQYWLEHANHLGEFSPNTLAALHCIAVFYCQHAEWAKAEPLLFACLERRRRSLGERHPDYLSTAYWTAFCWHWQGKTEEALDCYANCLHLQEEVLGRYHSETLQTLNQYASLLQCADVQGEEVLASFQDYHKRKREKYGEKHPQSIVALQQLAYCTEKQGDLEQAETLHKQVYKSCLEVFGERDVRSWQAMKQLAIIYEKQDRYIEAESYARTYRMHAKTVQKTKPELYFDAVNVLISVFWSAGKIQEVEQMIQDLLFYTLDHFGYSHAYARSVESLSEALELWKLDLAGERRPLTRSKKRQNSKVIPNHKQNEANVPNTSWISGHRNALLDLRFVGNLLLAPVEATTVSSSVEDNILSQGKAAKKSQFARVNTSPKASYDLHSPTSKVKQNSIKSSSSTASINYKNNNNDNNNQRKNQPWTAFQSPYAMR